MEVCEYVFDRWVDKVPVILLRPLNEIIRDFLIDEALILIFGLICFVIGYAIVKTILKIYDLICRHLEDSSTQTDLSVRNKTTQTLNYYKQYLTHTLTRRLIVVEESLAYQQ